MCGTLLVEALRPFMSVFPQIVLYVVVQQRVLEGGGGWGMDTRGHRGVIAS